MTQTKALTRAGWALTGLFGLFMLGASVLPKLVGMQAAYDNFVPLGWPAEMLLMVGLFELAFTLLYIVPRTSFLGAVLMTALLGGALATHVRVGSPMLSHTLFGIYLALFMWAGLWLRSPALRGLLPFANERSDTP